ncbi:MAG TPA: hypothetical protein VHL98_08650 [Microvirga sp.]|nr:hypothetical protein [Microvirga sp.]
MIHTPATFLAVAGTAFVLASYAPAALEARAMLPQEGTVVASLDPRIPAPQERIRTAASATGKGDRLGPPRPEARERPAVSVVEIVGLAQATVILRDRDGTVLYRSDPLSNTTIVAKGADLPVVTLKDAPAAPTSQQPTEPSSVQGLSPKREGQDVPGEGVRRSRRPIGCEGALSPLVRGDAQRIPSRCLAQAAPLSAS